MKKLSMVSLALMALVGSAAGVCAAPGETFTGTASATGTFKRPLLLVDNQRYELKPSEKAEASVKGTLEKFSKGDTGTYTVKGTRQTFDNGAEGILVDSITPAK